MTTCGIGYIKSYGNCDHESHNGNKIVNGYFLVDVNNRKCNYCKKCIQKITSLFLWSVTQLNMTTKSYNIKGIYLKRKFGCNYFKLKSNCKLLKFLHELKESGFKVPMFGSGNRQIAIAERHQYKDTEHLQTFDMRVKLQYWENPTKNKFGYKIIIA